MKYYNGRGHFGISFSVIINQSQYLLEDLATKKNKDVINLKKEISIKLIKSNLKKNLSRSN